MPIANKTHGKKMMPVLIGFLIFAAFVIVLNPDIWSKSDVLNEISTVGYREDNLVLRDQDTILGSKIDKNSFYHLEKGKIYTLSTVITYDGSQDNTPYGFIHLDHIFCRVILDGEEIFHHMPEDDQRWDRSRSAGFLYKAFPLPRDCMGKEIKIELLSLLSPSIEHGMPDLMFGDLTSMIHTGVLSDIFANAMVLICLLMGITSILFASIVLKGSDYRESVHIGIFFLLFAVYFTTECQLNAYFIGNPYYIYLINYMTFSLLPISMIGFMRERVPQKFKRICTYVMSAEIIIFAVQCTLHFTGKSDFREMVSINHLICTLEAAFVTFFSLKIDDRKKRKAIFMQILPIVIGFAMDIIIYRSHWTININDATFTILGVAIFLSMEIVRVGKASVSAYVNSTQSSMYQKMAYSDVLTGVGNRRAYDEEISRIEKNKRPSDSVIVIAADLNKLKYVNDNYGHSAGDMLIRSAAQIMSRVAGNRGKVFRTGGDEFSAFLYNTDIKQTLELINQIRQGAEQFNLENEFPMSIAVGYSVVTDNNIMDAVKDADRKMYEDKARQKAFRE